MAERTGVGRRRSHRAKRTSIFLEVPVSSGGRQQRDLISVRASDGLWSPSGWLDRSRIIWTRHSAEGENFCRRNALRSWYSIASSPFASSQVDICGKIVSGMAARTWSAWVWEDFTLRRRNCTSARRNHIAASTVENVGSLKCRTPAGEALIVVAWCREPVGAAGTSSVGAAGTSPVGAVGTSSVGMAKAKASNSGVTNVTTVDLL